MVESPWLLNDFVHVRLSAPQLHTHGCVKNCMERASTSKHNLNSCLSPQQFTVMQ